MQVSQLLMGTVASVFLLATSARCDEEVARVEQFGNPSNWHLSGVESFDPEDVKRALSRDFDVVLAAHPQARRADLSAAMRERLLEGYRSVGFANADGTVLLDEQQRHVNIRVTEGKRYRCGIIRVIGLEGDVAEQIERSLSTQQLPETAITPVVDDDGEPMHWLDQNGDKVDLEKALWSEGKPAAFHQSIRTSIEQRISRTLAELGYVNAKVDHELVRDEATANLLVRIQDIGSQAVLREIEISGNDRNSRDEIVAHLKLRVGERFTSADKHRTLLALRESARFVEQHVETKTIDANGGIKLNIALKELSVAPRLSEPLTREDQALLKLHRWETRGEGRHLDRVLHAEAESGSFDGVLSPTAGLVVTFHFRGSQDSGKSVAHALLASAEETVLYNLHDRRCFVLPIEKPKLAVTTSLKVQGEEAERPFKFMFSFGFSSFESDEQGQPIEMKTSTEPVYYLAMARLQHPVYSWSGDELTLRTDYGMLTIDSGTGRLLERSFTSDAYGACTFEYRSGAFDEALERLKRATAGFSNEFDAEHPISSTFRLGWSLLKIFAALKPDVEMLQRSVEPSAVAAIEKLLDQGLLHACDEAFVFEAERSDDNDFSIPAREPFRISSRGVGRVAASLTDLVFSRDTWPSNVWRETALFLAGHRDYTGAEFARVVNDDSLGPLGHWVLAELLEAIASSSSKAIAQRGMQRVGREGFERDVALLTANWSGDLERPVRALCSLSDEEVAALGRIVLDDTDQLVRAVQVLRQSDPVINVKQSVMFALGQLWVDGWRQRMSQRLQTISQDRLPRVAKESKTTAQ